MVLLVLIRRCVVLRQDYVSQKALKHSPPLKFAAQSSRLFAAALVGGVIGHAVCEKQCANTSFKVLLVSGKRDL